MVILDEIVRKVSQMSLCRLCEVEEGATEVLVIKRSALAMTFGHYTRSSTLSTNLRHSSAPRVSP